MKRLWLYLLGFALVGCNEDTGSELVTFSAYAAGPQRAIAGEPYVFDSAVGYHVQLEHAQLTIGALYLNRARPTLGAQENACVLPGVYAAEVTSGITLDAISPEPVEFPVAGQGTADRALTGEVWLTGGRIDATKDPTPILIVSGTASRADISIGFHGVVTISQNRSVGSPDPATPGANPLCKQRIVTPIPIDIVPSNRGQLELRVEPEQWFDHVEFSQLPGATEPNRIVEIPDSSENPAAVQLYQGLRSIGAYRFDWVE